MNEKVYMVPNPTTPNEAIQFDEEICNGCNFCVDNCRTDVLMPNPEEYILMIVGIVDVVSKIAPDLVQSRWFTPLIKV